MTKNKLTPLYESVTFDEKKERYPITSYAYRIMRSAYDILSGWENGIVTSEDYIKNLEILIDHFNLLKDQLIKYNEDRKNDKIAE